MLATSRSLLVPGLMFTLALAACARPAPVAKMASSPAEWCLADDIPTSSEAVKPRSSCILQRGECHAACNSGDLKACIEVAYALERGAEEEQKLAMDYYARACRGGELNGCTNYGANKRLGKGRSRVDPACTTRIFERACAGREPWGCGMYGMALLTAEGVARDVPRARSVLQEACLRDRAFPCAVLADALREGAFGAPDARKADALDKIACESGIESSCSDEAPSPVATPQL
jgi:hypothetical protein